jgi:hypothetical protein
MGYGVNSWASQAGRARAAGKRKARRTTTGRKSSRGSAPRAASSKTKRRALHQSLLENKRRVGWEHLTTGEVVDRETGAHIGWDDSRR